MEHNENLERLEQFVEKLVTSHNQLKKEKSEIMAQLQEKQQEIAELQETVKCLQEDKTVVHSQVTGLIDRIDEWEKMLASEESGQDEEADGDKSQNLPEDSSTLFNMTSEQPL